MKINPKIQHPDGTLRRVGEEINYNPKIQHPDGTLRRRDEVPKSEIYSARRKRMGGLAAAGAALTLVAGGVLDGGGKTPVDAARSGVVATESSMPTKTVTVQEEIPDDGIDQPSSIHNIMQIEAQDAGLGSLKDGFTVNIGKQVDKVAELNPDISDMSHVEPGQQVIIPDLKGPNDPA